LAWAFVEAAHFALKYNDAAKRFYDRKRARGNTALATKALARRHCKTSYRPEREPARVGAVSGNH
jgi:transposase